ncbi:MAG: hypothetical protein K9M84_01130 [Spirochaetia bacterium]|nr:hypothetical protein [Spirochaetia bacterium]MCF7940192.1 hypothetical protein [Spirochaetia bacterium]
MRAQELDVVSWDHLEKGKKGSHHCHMSASIVQQGKHDPAAACLSVQPPELQRYWY